MVTLAPHSFAFHVSISQKVFIFLVTVIISYVLRFKGNLLEDGDYDKDAFSDTTALLKMTSNDDLCMVVSVQDLSCPVYDLDKPAAIFQGGLYQTADTVAGITFTRSQFPHGAFLVLVVKSDDEVCRTKAVADDFLLQSLYRQKNVTFSIERKISEQEYLAATAGILFIFGTVYLLVLAVSCTLCCKCNRNSNVSHASERSPLVAEEAPVMNYGSSSIEVTQEEGEQSVEDGADVIQQAPLERLRAHMLHGVVEDERSEDSSLDEIDVDLLLDAETDKDVFRTKATLFVCDLARKSPEVLDKKYNLYKWNLLTVAVFYGLPVVQLVLTYQDVTSATGDLDRCYYNFLCANPLGVFMDFNHVFSNVGYILLGLLFVFLVWRRDVLHRREVREVEGIGRRQQRYFGLPQHFGMYYAMGLALVMEGVMSACYHVCPSHINFQFDTAFMYTISILILLKIYQARHADINANAYTAFGVLAFVIFIASIGVLHGNVYFWAFFSIVHVSSCLILSAQIYYVGRFRLNAGLSRRAWLILVNDVRALISRQWIALKPLYPDRFVLLLLLNAVNWGWIAYGLSSLATERADFASFLLAIFISNVMLYTLFYVVMKLLHGERVGWQPAVYIAAATVTWFGAMYFFVHKSTTWVLPPAQSRHFNQECKLFHFYDNHDIWHLLSAISLFLSFMILLTLDDDLCKIPRDKIFVF